MQLPAAREIQAHRWPPGLPRPACRRSPILLSEPTPTRELQPVGARQQAPRPMPARLELGELSPRPVMRLVPAT